MGVYGMAAHIAADIFAHSAYAKQDGSSSYTRIIHKPNHGTLDDADNPDYIPNRFACARELVHKLVALYDAGASTGGLGANISNIVISSYDGSFKLRHIIYFVYQKDSSVYNNNLSFFNTINTDAAL